VRKTRPKSWHHLLLIPVLLYTYATVAQAQGKVFLGESCAQCHAQFRDKSAQRPPILEPPQVSQLYDVIIVGGGIGGLTAAYYLKDTRVLVLEKEDKVGGKVRQETWGKSTYPVAAGYMAEEYGIIQTLFNELGLHGAPVQYPFNSLYTPSGKIISDPFGKGLRQYPASASTKKTIRKMMRGMSAIMDKSDLGEMPPMPKADEISKKHRALDNVSFYDYMQRHYGKEIARFADDYCESVFGIGAKNVSAFAGLIFFAADFSNAQNVTWNGGPGIVAETLANRVGGEHIETGALVTSVYQDENYTWVTYKKDGQTYTLPSKTVIMAVPSFVAKQIIVELPDWKKRALSQVRYSSYALGIIALSEVVYNGSYDLWSGLNTVFTDLVVSEWGQQPIANPTPDTPAQILHAYIPLGEKDGREELLTTSDEEMSTRIANDLERLFPGAKSKIHGIRIIRWGHAMPIDYPGYLTQTRLEIAKPIGRIFFAGVDTEMPCIEGAISSGHRAASEVRQLLQLQPNSN